MIHVTMDPPEGGRLHLDGQTFDPRISYPVGSEIRIKIVPALRYQFTRWSGDVPEDHAYDVPLNMVVKDADQHLVAHFQPGEGHASELSVDADFENGNGMLRYNHRGSRYLIVEPLQIKASNNIWWHFTINGITPGECLRLDVEHSGIAGDCNPVYSYDGVTWQRFTSTRSPYIQHFTKSAVEVARNIPYTYSRSVKLAAKMGGPYARVFNLAISEEGRFVKSFRFTDPDIKDAGKQVVWIMARLHAFESHASWYAEGVCKWLHAHDETAAALLRRSIIYVTPIMDVDSVYNGSAGKEQINAQGQRVDFNRTWGEDSPWAAIRGAQHLLSGLAKKHDITAFIDLHDPWFYEAPHWGGSDVFDVQGFAKLFTEELEATESGARWKHELRICPSHPATSRSDSEPTQGMVTGGRYAQTHFVDGTHPENKIVLLIETPHWQDGYGHDITLQSLYAYGEALGRTLHRFLK